MSIMDSLKKPIGGKKQDASGGELVLASQAETAAPPAGPAPTKASKGAAPVLSASPRANLLPPEIGLRHRKLVARRWMRVAVFVVVLLAAAMVGGAWALSTAAQATLESARSDATQLAQEEAGFAEVKATLNGIDLGTAAQRVAGSTEIDIQGYLQALQASLPAGVALKTVDIQAASITEAYPEADEPLSKPNVGTVTFTALSADLPRIPDWLNSMSSLPGYVDAVPGSVTLQEDGYNASVTMYIDEGIFTHRFDPEKEG